MKKMNWGRTGVWLLLMLATIPYVKANVTDEVDNLTREWLQIEAQEQKLVLDWQEQEPVVRQRIALLKKEKAQLQSILAKSTDSQDDVEARRNALLAEQNTLESQQEDVANALTSLVSRVNSLYDSLPPPLQITWDKEDGALAGEDGDNPSKILQVTLAKLSRLSQFDTKLTVNEEVLTTPEGKDIVVKQLYLGSQLAWFANSDGTVAGSGYAIDGKWTWHFDGNDNGEAINQALAVFERRQQPAFITLPLPFNAPASVAGGDL
ncbi:DUF3450 family protein [Alteromonas sp. C1M14]|uniref:DUF3450 family protein n=1 Tax=Alteromonas sp. C1M14 TaxID=2841567 RepID=UPI001C08E8D6|nr:DUF3450 family protein [Alteromonas sp. C1M14]MBU2978295.1 DUF3450 domain-containing protein [Alteromonas sp. C1M14]